MRMVAIWSLPNDSIEYPIVGIEVLGSWLIVTMAISKGISLWEKFQFGELLEVNFIEKVYFEIQNDDIVIHSELM